LHIGDPVLGPMGLLLGRLFAVPVVATVHGLDVTYPHPLYQLLIRAVLKRLDGIVAISAAAARECVARGANPTCCHVVAVGVDPEMPLQVSRDEARSRLEARLGLRLQEARVILTVGRLVPRKGVAHFVESVLSRVVERRPNTRYLVVGDGPDRQRIAALATAGGLAENVCLLGRLSQADVHAAYRACDLFLMPNIPVEGDIEGFGLVVLEAGAAERWVVASDLEGIRDAIHPGQNGSLVSWDDPEAQAQAIVSLLDDDHERDRLGRQARQFVVRNFSWPGIADRYLDLFDRLGSLARASR
jgi:phosphatidylinositol alpha-1,6-mannosyltransferase